MYVGPEKLNKEYASALKTVADKLAISIHFFSGGIMSDTFQIQFSKAIKRRSRKDAQALRLNHSQTGIEDENDDDDDDDDNNNDDDDDDNDDNDIHMKDPSYLRRKNAFRNEESMPEECLNFYREMCKQRSGGSKRTAGRSLRHSEWPSTSKLINKKPKMGIKKLRRTLQSSNAKSDTALEPAGAGILTRAAKRRMEALEGENAATPSNTTASSSSSSPSRTEIAPTRGKSTPSNAAVTSNRQNERGSSSKTSNQNMSRGGEDGATAAPNGLKSDSTSDANITDQTDQCDFKADTLIIGEITPQYMYISIYIYRKRNNDIS